LAHKGKKKMGNSKKHRKKSKQPDRDRAFAKECRQINVIHPSLGEARKHLDEAKRLYTFAFSEVNYPHNSYKPSSERELKLDAQLGELLEECFSDICELLELNNSVYRNFAKQHQVLRAILEIRPKAFSLSSLPWKLGVEENG
jgi:hypothetical protein